MYGGSAGTPKISIRAATGFVHFETLLKKHGSGMSVRIQNLIFARAMI
jgi:hypothetical protein